MIKKRLQRSLLILLITLCANSALLYGNHQLYTSSKDTIQKLSILRYKINPFKQYVQTKYSTDVFWEPAEEQVQLQSKAYILGYHDGEYLEDFVQIDGKGKSVFLHPTWITLVVNKKNKLSSRIVFIDLLGEIKLFKSNKLYFIKNDRSAGLPYVLYLQVHTDFDDIDDIGRYWDIEDIIPEIELQIDSKLK
jgi:hypothetical protein